MFYLVCFSQLITLIGSEFTKFVIPIWLYEQNGSAETVGIALAAAFLPRILIGPFVGTWVDRSSKKAILMLSEAGQAISVLTILLVIGATGEGPVATPLISACLFLQSLFSVFQHPGIAALTPRLLRRDQIQKGNALLSMVDSSSLIIGPVAAGLLLSWFDIHTLLWADAITFIASCAILGFLPSEPGGLKFEARRIMQDTLVSLKTLKGNPERFHFLTLGACLNLAISLSFGLLNPYLKLLSDDRTELVGVAHATSGAFEILAAIVFLRLPAIRRRVHFQLNWMLVLALAGCLALAMAPSIYFAIFGLATSVFSIALINAANRTAWQVAIAKEELGRFFALKRTVSHGLAPMGFLLSGWIFDNLLRTNLGVGELESFRVMFALSALVLVAVVVSNKRCQWVKVWDEQDRD